MENKEANTIDYVFKKKPVYHFFKRAFDIFASVLFLLIFSLPMLILLFIKFCEDGHNPVYVSYRVGKNGKIIKFHKIRSMRVDAQEMKAEMIEQGLNELDGPAFKMKDDPRVTKFGKFLRKSSLDETLQVWDILCGRMSVVGPRPPIQSEVEQYDEYQRHRLDVKGGLLCLWQVTKDRHSMSFDKWVELDIEYIKRRSIWLDFKIIMKGLWLMIIHPFGNNNL